MKKILLFAVGLILASSKSQASPLLWIDNGNYYDLVIPTSTNDWFSAKTASDNSTYLGFSGHLATLTSADENNFLISNFATGINSFQGSWLGGKAPEGWLDGPENGQAFTYTNWGGIEPNNEGYAYMNLGTAGPVSAGQWADDSGTQGFPEGGSDPVIGYFVEYEGNHAVPEPASVLLLGSGLLGAFIRRKRQ